MFFMQDKKKTIFICYTVSRSSLSANSANIKTKPAYFLIRTHSSQLMNIYIYIQFNSHIKHQFSLAIYLMQRSAIGTTDTSLSQIHF